MERENKAETEGGTPQKKACMADIDVRYHEESRTTYRCRTDQTRARNLLHDVHESLASSVQGNLAIAEFVDSRVPTEGCSWCHVSTRLREIFGSARKNANEGSFGTAILHPGALGSKKSYA